MLTSLSLIFLLGLLLGKFFNRLKLPNLLGMILTGMILGPYALDRIDASILHISADLRELALIIILTRAGLALDARDLKKVGRPAILMSFLPASFEILGVMLLAPLLFGISRFDAAVMGSVLAAVSPAVVVPRMIRIMEEGYGREKGIPQLILAGASADDVFVIVLFTAFLGLAGGGGFQAGTLLQVPVSIATGILVGAVTGRILVAFFRAFHMRDTVKILIILSLSGLLLELEAALAGSLPMSGLIAIMSLGLLINQKYPILAGRLSAKYSKLWVGAEVLLFALVGAAVDLDYALRAGFTAAVIVLLALLFRMAGVEASLLGTPLIRREKLFVMVAYTPKATVQAAIGAIPLAMGLASGQLILTVAVAAILITAPLGAVAIDHLYPRLLSRDAG